MFRDPIQNIPPRESPGGHWNIGYPNETDLKYKSRKKLSIDNKQFSCEIILKVFVK